MRINEQDQNVNTASKTKGALYCAGCNERFALDTAATVCPRCGAEIPSAVNADLDETLLVRPGDAAHDIETIGIRQPAEADTLIGRELHVYQCESLLGSGGMGRVYLAHHRQLHRKCALKILSPRLVADHLDYVQRFQEEARAAAALIHPNIVTTHAIGTAEGLHFLEMEFVPGRSLQNLMEREGRLTPVRATALVAQIAEGLALAHRSGIVHRDLKLDNVLMTRRGVPKIADFGLAKRIAGNGLNDDNRLMGTPNFMAPELFQGIPATPSSDIYSLGVCYFLLLTGQLPFVAGHLNALKEKIIHEPLPSVRRLCRDVPLEMAECVSLLLSKTPGNRPADATEATQLLKAVLGHVRDIESLLQDAFGDDPTVTWSRLNSRYELTLNLPDGRKQRLYIEPSDHSPTERLLLIYSICCDARPDYYEHALRLNAEIPHGGLAVRNIDGDAKFVMIDTYPRATVDPEEIRRSATEVAYRADAIENLLTGCDEN